VLTPDSDDVYAPFGFRVGTGLQICRNGGDQVGAFFGCDGFFGVAVGGGGAGFDFHKDGDFGLPGDDVNFAVGRAEVALNDGVAAPGEVFGGQVFAPAAEGLAVQFFRHYKSFKIC